MEQDISITFQKLREKFKSDTGAAEALGIPQRTYWGWVKNGIKPVFTRRAFLEIAHKALSDHTDRVCNE